MDPNDQPTTSSAMDTDEDLSNFIEMVTSYKCKFCSFASATAQDIASHVRSVHIATSSPVKAGQQTQMSADLATSSGKSLDIHAQGGEAMSTCIMVESDGELVISDPRISTEFPGTTEIEIVTEMSGAEPMSQPEVSITCSESESMAATSQIVDASMQTGSATALGSRMTKHVATSAPITKELFLCGQCSIGFNSIDDCKVHMIQNHNVSLPSPNTRTEYEEELLCGKVSVGTQVAQRKKPGRKPKDAATNSFAPAKRSRDDSDEEYTINLGNGGTNRYMFSGCNRNRSRRIRPPRALKEDYYLEKRAKKTRDKRYSQCYTVTCGKTGCYARFKLQESLDIHVRCHRDGEGEYGFQCYECLVICTKWKELRMHLWRLHKIDTDLLACDHEQCEFKTDTTHKLKIHQQIHGSERPYCCDICGKGFKQFSQMRNHQMIHVEVDVISDADKWYTPKQCELCKRSFANQKCLLKHVQAVHEKIKPYVCRFCGHSAARKAMLQLHLRTHTGEKPFKCELCTYVTGDHNSLRRHKMRHSGQRPYKCQYCDYSCIQAISLKCHMKNKHPGMAGVYFCNLCHFRTVNKQSYENHQEDHNQGLVAVTKDPPTDTLEVIQQVEVPAHQVVIDNGTGQPEHFQVQAVQTGEAQISAEDLVKLTANYEGLVPSDVSAAQLIYSALNAMSQNATPATEVTIGGDQQQQGQRTHVQLSTEGARSTIAEGGVLDENVRTHTITFHLATPSSDGEQDQDGADGPTNQQMVLTQSMPVQLLHHVQRVDGTALPVGVCASEMTPTTIPPEHAQVEAVTLIHSSDAEI